MINFNKPFIEEKDFEYIKDSFVNNKLCGDGKYTKLVGEWFEKNLNIKNLLLTTSCSSSLDMSAILCELKEEDEIILPSYTFVSTANAFLLRNVKLIFAEIDPKTMNISLEDVKNKITSKTKVICPVHYAGTSCDMDELIRIASKNNIKIVEDAAQAVGSFYKGKPLGTFGDYGCYSFHETKNYAMGEGGALIVKGEDNFLKAEMVREKGTDRSLFLKGMVDKYTWREMGSSYLPAELPVALLYSQLMKYDEIMTKRMYVWNTYHALFEELEKQGKIIRPFIPEYNEHNAHMYYLILPNMELRDKFIQKMKEHDIQTVFHYIPLHLSPMGQKMGYKEGDLPKTEEYAGRLVRLPMYAGMTQEELDKITDITIKVVNEL